MQYGSEHESLLRAVLYDPDDDAPRLIYADYLDERDDCLMAEFIRLQIAIYRGTDREYDCPECGGYTTHRLIPFSLIKELCDRCNATGKLVGRTPLVKRDQELWEQIKTRFNVPYATSIRVERGFVASVTSRTRNFLKHASAMFTWPISRTNCASGSGPRFSSATAKARERSTSDSTATMTWNESWPSSGCRRSRYAADEKRSRPDATHLCFQLLRFPLLTLNHSHVAT